VPDDVHIHRRSPPHRAVIAATGHALRRTTIRCPSGRRLATPL
jgi:hypothetical protein